MNAAVHIMQAVNWKKFTLEEWLKQFGAWCQGTGTCSTVTNSSLLARLIDRAKWENTPASQRSAKPIRLRCRISDNEARAVQRLILDAQGLNNEIVNQWMAAVIGRYFYNNSWKDLAEHEHESVNAMRQDVACGLAFLRGRNAFLV